MNELSTIVEIYPVASLPEDFNTADLGSSNLPGYYFQVDHFNLEPLLEESASGILYNCDKELYADRKTDKSEALFAKPVSSIIRFKDTQGNNIIIGTKTIPAKVTISPYLTRIRISMKCKMLRSPY